MWLSRLHAIHKYKYESEHLFTAKLKKFEGLELCKKVGDYHMEDINHYV